MPNIPIPRDRLKVVVPRFRVKYRDIFDTKAFYVALHEWLLEYDWKDREDGAEHWETYYAERIDQAGAREIWWQWRCVKDPQNAPMLRYYLDFDVHCIAITPAEVIEEGMKLKVSKGEIEIFMQSWIEELYKAKFDDAKQWNWLLRRAKEVFSQRVYKRIFSERKSELYKETYALQNFIKQWFKLKRYLPYEEVKGFFPPQTWPSHIKR